MNLTEILKKRYSVRTFSNQKVEDEKIEEILQSGRLAPTACNLQPQRIFVLKSEESLVKLKNSTIFHFDAPIAMLVCYDKVASWKRKFDGHDMGEVDVAIVTTQMILKSTELGLGTTWVGYFDPNVVKKEFNLPDDIIPVAILPIGYPAENAEPNQRHFERYDLNKTVQYI